MRGVAHGGPFNVLLVEDNPGDVRLAMEALREGTIPKKVHVVGDGVEALDYLNSLGTKDLPDLVLLDLNLPRKNGHEVLAAIRANDRLRLTAVVVFTSSAAEQDIRSAYELHANSYVIKPQGFAELAETIHSIERFWLQTAAIPFRIPVEAVY